MARVGRLSLLVAATACCSVSTACGARSSLDLSSDQDAATADVSVVRGGVERGMDATGRVGQARALE